MFSREDWTIFRNLSTITHKAGVPAKHLRRLVIKELVDNALDATSGIGRCKVFRNDEDTYQIIDSGPGIDGTDQEIATLFSIKRPLTSSKILRLPSRGALGNGLRVVSGVLLASGGTLRVATRGRQMEIILNDDGTSTPSEVEEWAGEGTQVTVHFGKSVPRDAHTTFWGDLANDFGRALVYNGKTSPWWYDSDSFYELLMAAGTTQIESLIQRFDGITHQRAFEISSGLPKVTSDFDRDTADQLLGKLRVAQPKNVDPKKIGRVVDGADQMPCYHRKMGVVEISPGRGMYKAHLPYVIEAMASGREKDAEEDYCVAYVNGTPITGEVSLRREGKTEIAMFGCGIRHKISRVSSRKFNLYLNITIPYMPITTDGKAPDFEKFLFEVMEVTQKSTRKLKTFQTKGVEQGTIILKNIERGIAKASGDGKYRFSLRQLYYAIRPYVLDANPEASALDYTYFARVISGFENDYGEIKQMYRDPRGVLYHPHTGQTIPIGTIAVEEYERPAWTFKHILYIEKEGLFEVLKQAAFPERYDCALLSSKGFASRAVKDLIDMLGDHDEEINVYCLHDADGPGTVIYESLQGATIARKARRVKIHNLGLEPWEGVAMGLQVEEFGQRKSKVPVGDYINKQDDEVDSPIDMGKGYTENSWRKWLQTKRIELNAMTSPEFLEWLEGKFEEMGVAKVVPPEDVMTDTFWVTAKAQVRENLVFDILEKANIDQLVLEKMQNLVVPKNVTKMVQGKLAEDRSELWDAPVKAAARDAAEKASK